MNREKLCREKNRKRNDRNGTKTIVRNSYVTYRGVQIYARNILARAWCALRGFVIANSPLQCTR